MTYRAFSFGGGVQSMAVLVLAAQGRIQYDAFVFANVGEDSENPATLAYLTDIARPYAAKHGLLLEEVRWVRRDGGFVSLYDAATAPTKDVPIPAWLGSGAPGNRKCTERWKIGPVARYLKAHAPAVLGMGISLDEIQRVRTNSGFTHYTVEYPLIDLHLRRRDCVAIIEGAGLPVPPKSSCWFCPFQSPRRWQAMRHAQPEQFAKAVTLEKTINAKRSALGRDAVFLSSDGKPLMDATSNDRQLEMFSTVEDACDSGYCLT